MYRYISLTRRTATNQAPRNGRRPLIPHSLRPEIQQRITSYLSKGCRVTSRLTGQIVHDVLRKHQLTALMSKRTIQRLNSSFNLSWRRATTGHVQNCKNVESVKEKFVNDLQMHNDIPDELVFNLDETSIWLRPCSSYSLAPRGSRNVVVDGVEDKRCVTAILSSSAAGKLLRSTIIWEGKTERCHVHGEDVTNVAHQCHSHNKWSSADLTCQHIKECVLPEISDFCSKTRGYIPTEPATFPASVLLLDSWKPHWDDKVIQFCDAHQIRTFRIPPNFTNVFQPNDQLVNKVFKDKLTRLYDDHMWTISAENSVAPNLSLTYLKPRLLHWVGQVQKSVSGTVVKCSWAKATCFVRPHGYVVPLISSVVVARCAPCECFHCFVQRFLRLQYCPPMLKCCSCCSSHARPIVQHPKTEIQSSKKRGRPRKVASELHGESRKLPIRKRGRPKNLTSEPVTPRKRGRPAKVQKNT